VIRLIRPSSIRLRCDRNPSFASPDAQAFQDVHQVHGSHVERLDVLRVQEHHLPGPRIGAPGRRTATWPDGKLKTAIAFSSARGGRPRCTKAAGTHGTGGQY
jgi:hypothetical protein